MRRSQNKTILIVEDEAVISLWLSKTLDDLGYRVCGNATSAEEALRLVAETKPDLVLMDIILSGPMDGIQAARIIQENFDTPVIFVTARDEEDLLNQAEDIRPYGIIAKPVQRAQLRFTLEIAFRIKAEEKNSELKARFDQLVSQGPVVIFTISPASGFPVTYVSDNAEAVHGYAAEEFLADPSLWRTISHPDDLQTIVAHFEQALHKDQPPLEHRVIGKQGEIVWLMCQCRFLRDENGTPFMGVGYQLDITPRKLAEEAQRESEERLRSLWDAIPHAVEELDLKGRILFVNKTFREVYDDEGIPGKPVWDYCVNPEEAAASKQFFETLVSDEPPPKPFFIALKDKTGRTVKAQVNWNYQRDPSGRVRGFVAVRTDVSNILEAEVTLREKERTVRALLNGTRDFAFLLTPQGVVKEANEAFAARFGLTPDSIRERRMTDVITDQAVGKARRKRSLEAVKDKRSVFFEDEQNGRRFEHAVTPVINDENEVELLAVYSRDVTERNLAEQALRESEERFAALFKLSPQIIALTNFGDNIFLEVNDAFLKAMGCSRQEILGKSSDEMNFWADPKERDAMRREVAAGNHIVVRETRLRRKDGTIWPALFSCAPVVISGKRMLLSLVVDISERKALEEEVLRAKDAAEAASKAKTEFLTRISHEIRTPMNSILGLGEVLAQSGLDEKRRGYADSLMRAGERLLTIINDVLDFSSIEAGRLRLEKTVFDPSALVAEVVEFLSPRSAEKGLFLRAEISPDIPPAAWGDAKRLWQILMNLGGNAVKFTDRGGVILRLGPGALQNETPALLFEVLDTGIGIPQNAKQDMFKHFSRLPDAHGRYGGTGLGLAISKRLVENIGGEIGFESDFGRGSRFFFTIPLETADPAALPRPVSHDKAQKKLFPPAGRVFKALLAEDNPANVNVVKLFLENSPFTITVAENGAQAVSFRREQDFDVILMDIDMPLMDGCEASMIIRNFERENNRPPAPIIALTAHAFLEHKKKMAEAGCNDYLAKPIRKNELISAMLRHIQKAEGWPEQPEAQPESPTGESALFLTEPELGDKVAVAPSLRPIIPAFLDIQEKNLERIRLAVEDGDFPNLRRLGHNLRGAALTYGFRKMAVLGERLEKAALERRLDLAANELRSLTKHFHNVHIVYDDIRNSEDAFSSQAGKDDA